MINFFRRSRKKIVDDNKPIKYIKYAIGEITLVVIGILIALSINNWNENRINDNKEQYYLNRLKNDLVYQLQEIDKRLDQATVQIGIMDSIITNYKKNNGSFRRDPLNDQLIRLLAGANFKVFNTTFNELNSTGQLVLIKNKELRSSIISINQDIEKRKVDIISNSENVYYTQIFPVISLYINFDSSEQSDSVIARKLSNPETKHQLFNAIHINFLLLKSNYNMISGLKSNIESDFETLNSEIQKYENRN